VIRFVAQIESDLPAYVEANRQRFRHCNTRASPLRACGGKPFRLNVGCDFHPTTPRTRGGKPNDGRTTRLIALTTPYTRR
jgi:hypothetical protein